MQTGVLGQKVRQWAAFFDRLREMMLQMFGKRRKTRIFHDF
jgi:hypothetical protein